MATATVLIKRQEASGPGWQERFVDADRASVTPSVAVAVSQSLSYVVIPNFASLEERCALQESALVLQDLYLREGDKSREFKDIEVKWVTECSRFSVEKLLDAKTKATSKVMLGRLLELLEFGVDDRVDVELSNLATLMFGANSGLQDMNAKWYDEMSHDRESNPEPMVNIYEEGGFFKRHGDGMSITLLVILSDAEDGGGTAFYLNDPEEEINADDKPNLTPERIERPAEGTALIWGPTLQHSAMPVTSGMRSVYVGSFDLENAKVNPED
mmetsp:Transcript_21830/g.47444  ORF Transcript_21830/g.47444 Transcript_21830/m.47444 type:complete len:271 (-) Transcript_21830:268-1080(-)